MKIGAYLKNTPTEPVNMSVPRVVVNTGSSNPSNNRCLRSPSNKKKRLFRAAKRTNQPDSWLKYYGCVEVYKTEVHKRKNILSITLPLILLSNPCNF